MSLLCHGVVVFGLLSRLHVASEPSGTVALIRFHRLMGLGAP
jgi:hypothetical protein